MVEWWQVAIPVALGVSLFWLTIIVVTVGRAYTDGHIAGQEDGLIRGYKQGYKEAWEKKRC